MSNHLSHNRSIGNVTQSAHAITMLTKNRFLNMIT